MMLRAYHVARGNPRHKVLIPDTAHGTNPASAAFNGYSTVTLESGHDGRGAAARRHQYARPRRGTYRAGASARA